MSNDINQAGWRRQTNLVRGGIERSQFDEISEAMYLTSSYSYETAEQAQRAEGGNEDVKRYTELLRSAMERRRASIEVEREPHAEHAEAAGRQFEAARRALDQARKELIKAQA